MKSYAVVCCALLAAVCAAAGGDDQATDVSEGNWFNANSHWDAIARHCKKAVSEEPFGKYSLVSVFDESYRVLNTWANRGHKAVAFDIKRNREHDIITKRGFFTVLGMMLNLAKAGMMMFAPPCCMFIFLSSSQHRRQVCGTMGDKSDFQTRLGNRIALNTATLLRAALTFRPDVRAIGEQPSGSWMFKMPAFVKVIEQFDLKRCLTHQACWGADIQKPTHLLHTPNMAEQMSKLQRTFTNEDRAKLQARIKKDIKSGVRKDYYLKDKHGGVSGTKYLQSKAVYPQRLCTAMLNAWSSSKK